jgi:peptide/nickel transport system ATP-binding protein
MEILKVENLKMYYSLYGAGWVSAVDGISFNLEKGQSIGIVGESGCGKSSLGITLLRVLPENAFVKDGKVLLYGEDILKIPEEKFRRNIRWKKISMVFQGAMNSFNPLFTIGEQIVEAIKLHENISDKQAQSRTEELLRLVGLDPKRANNYPFELSGGMKQRAAIAMALALNPDILIADEPTTALDVMVQARVLHLIKSLQRDLKLSVIFISHDVTVISQMVEKVVVMYAGKFMELGSIEDVFLKPRHPYTYMLLKSVPDIKGRPKRLEGIPGAPPDLRSPPSGCRFHPRCPFAKDMCSKNEIEFTDLGNGHLVACLRASEIEREVVL